MIERGQQILGMPLDPDKKRMISGSHCLNDAVWRAGQNVEPAFISKMLHVIAIDFGIARFGQSGQKTFWRDSQTVSQARWICERFVINDPLLHLHAAQLGSEHLPHNLHPVAYPKCRNVSVERMQQ